MPTYAYRCPTCDDTFEKRRPMSESSAPATCTQGHEARRMMSAFLSVGPNGGASSSSSSEPVQWTGRDGCGGGCACH